MAKMFYTQEEATAKLKMTEDQLKDLVRNGKLREFRDAGKVNYKVDEINALAAARSSSGSSSGELVLEPIDDSAAGSPSWGSAAGIGSDVLSLADSDMEGTAAGAKPEKDKKDDTSISSVGISVFDEEDAEADPLAKTLLSDGGSNLGIEGLSGGSGLLELTRESDDTSLGAELLDELYTEEPSAEEGTKAGMAAAKSGSTGFAPMEAPPMEVPKGPAKAPAAVVVAAELGVDAFAVGTTGLLAVAVLVMCVAGLAVASMVRGAWPTILDAMYAKLWIFGAASLGVSLAAFGAGMFLGKRSQG